MEKKWLWITLSAFLASTGYHTIAYGQAQENIIQTILQKETSIEANKELLDQLLTEIGDKETNLTEIKEQLLQIEKEIQSTDQNIADIQEKIQNSRTQIFEKEKNLDDKKALLSRNLKIMHEKGEVSFVEFLLRSESLSSFLYRYQLLKDVGDQHKEVIDEIKSIMKTLESQKRQEQNMKNEQQLEILKQYRSKQEVAKLKAEQEQLITKINQQYNTVQEQIALDEIVIKQMIYEMQELAQKRTSEVPNNDTGGNDIVMPGDDLVDIAYKWVLYRGIGSEKPVIYSMPNRQLTLATYGDCSAFTRRVYMDAGYGHIGYTTADQIANPKGQFIEKVTDLKPGDLMYFGPTGSHVVYSHLPNGEKVATAHTAIYVGNGKMIDLAAGVGTISIKDFSEGGAWEWYVKNRWVGGKRFEKQHGI